MEKICNACGTLLTSENWYKWYQKKKNYKCNTCVLEKTKASPNYKNKRITTTIKKQFDKTLSRKISNFLKDAKLRSKAVEFTYAEVGVLMKQSCNYCGNAEGYNGLDRVDSSLGYLKTNTVPCCKMCNWGKNTLSTTAYIEHCEKVISHTRRIP